MHHTKVRRPRGRRRRHTSFLSAPASAPRAPRAGIVLPALALLLLLLLPALARAQDASAQDASAVETPAVAGEPEPGAPVVATTITRRLPGTPTAVPTPSNLLDLPAWLDYRTRNHLAALPLEARLFYRRGLMLAQSGSRPEALRLVRGAAELDPTFVSPRLTLASWLLLREPSQALLQYASVIELARQDFLLQLALAGNALYLLFQSLFLGLLAAGMIVVALRNRELRHALTERLGRLLRPETARWWAWAILILPFACGFGLALPTLVFLGLLWPMVKARERAVFVGLLAMLLAAPWATASLDRLALPLRDGQAPFYGVPFAATESPSEERHGRLAALARQHPDHALLQYAAAWTARGRGDLQAAEAGYRRVLTLSPGDDRAMNNLGNVLAMQGRTDEALALYRRAGQAEPGNAAAAFNASQIYTQRFDYHAATEALSRASALNFEMVKTYQSQTTDDGVLPLVDQWISPRAFWKALPPLRVSPASRGALPPAWRSHIECSGWGFSLAAVLLAALAVALGVRLNHSVPLRTCSNCGVIVCRRCARRRREAALCPACADVESGAETPEFARVLLLQQRQRVRHPQHLAQTALAALIPGAGLLAFRRVGTALLLLCVSAALVAIGAGFAFPFAYETQLTSAGDEVPLVVLLCVWVTVYAASILGYYAQVFRAEAEEAALAAPVKGRIRLSGRDRPALAA